MYKEQCCGGIHWASVYKLAMLYRVLGFCSLFVLLADATLFATSSGLKQGTNTGAPAASSDISRQADESFQQALTSSATKEQRLTRECFARATDLWLQIGEREK